MKVVVCQNCGEKYQLDDEDDINAFECSVCSGNLEELDGFSNDEEKVSSDYDSQNNSGLVLVYCTSCGLKYQLSESDNINEFECNSCGGSLDYISNMVSASTETTDSTNFTQNPLTETPLADDEIDEIIPIHAEANFVDDSLYSDSDVDEIIPIHAEANFVDDSLYSDSDVDEIIPIHAELYYYETEEILPDTLESYGDEEVISYGSIYDSTLGDVDEIIPIHAEKRYMETSRDIASGFAYKDEYEEAHESQEYGLVEVTDIPEDEMPESPVSLARQELSEEDQKLFARVQNEMVFDSPEEYEAFKLARYKYYTALSDILKDEYIRSMDKEFYKGSSVKRLRMH